MCGSNEECVKFICAFNYASKLTLYEISVKENSLRGRDFVCYILRFLNYRAGCLWRL
ncbi:hypothetical protein OROMI_033991 [Orobanche minor]